MLAAAGIAALEDSESSRKLIIGTIDPKVRLVVVRASDVPTYVQYGAAELGVAGKDVLLEHGAHWGASLYPLASTTQMQCDAVHVCALRPSMCKLLANTLRRKAFTSI